MEDNSSGATPSGSGSPLQSPAGTSAAIPSAAAVQGFDWHGLCQHIGYAAGLLPGADLTWPLVREVAALRADAVRYQWLRQPGCERERLLACYANEALDMYVDAAIGKAETANGQQIQPLADETAAYMAWFNANPALRNNTWAAWNARAAAPVVAPAAEPVAYGFPNTAITGGNHFMLLRERIPDDDQYGGALWIPLYAAPIAQAGEQQ